MTPPSSSSSGSSSASSPSAEDGSGSASTDAPGPGSLGRRFAASLRSRIAASLPTSAADWRLTGRTIRLVLGTPAYGFLALAVAVLVAVALAATAKLQFVVEIVLLGDLALARKLSLLRRQLPFLGGPYSALQGVLLYATAALVGTSNALLAYHLREHDLSVRGGSGSSLGVVLGTLGAGCAACGPAILGGIAALTGATGLAALPGQRALGALPLHGLEISFAAIALLVLSLYWLAEGMRSGEIRGCPVDPGGD